MFFAKIHFILEHIEVSMSNGLNLSRQFFETCLPLLKNSIPDILPYIAAGLVGEGSDCLALDDDISKDHDWGPAFCLWIPEDILRTEHLRLQHAIAMLPTAFSGYPTRMEPEKNHGRAGLLPLEGFYKHFLGISGIPEHWKEWRNIPEYHLCSCTNGAVFLDNYGQFSDIRQKLLAHYPQDILRKKLASRCMVIAQSGQYNLPRCLQRNDTIAAMLAAARFAEAALSMVFLLNRRYMPFYKWAARMVVSLPILGRQTAETLNLLSLTAWNTDSKYVAVENIETLCSRIAMELRDQHFTQETGSWLWNLGPSIQMGIHDAELRSLNVMED
jgi:hypothetical protein